MKIRGYSIKEILSFPKSFIINWKLFGLGKALLCPVFVANGIKCLGIKRGKVIIDSKDMYRGMISIGFDGSLGVPSNNKGYLIIGNKGKIVFRGTAGVAQGCSLRVDSGQLIIGNGFSCNTNGFISCTSEIEIGNDVLIGWNVSIRDSDGHKVYLNDVEKPSLKSVRIGNHVWIASEVDILKGAYIPDECIVGYRSCVTKRFEVENCLISGYPAKILQHGISWEK